MGRPTELKIRIARNVIFENDDLVQFENMVGRDNVSKEIRALIHNFLEDQKKGNASLDPLNLVKQIDQEVYDCSNNIVNATLDIYLFQPEDLRDYIEGINDIKILAKTETKAKTLSNLARNKKMELCAEERLKSKR